VFRLRKFEDLSQREIAMRLKISENTVEKQLARALRLLLAQIAADDQSPAVSPDRREECSENEGEFYGPP
jgi:DNA-directed RNA polymerase specialized sigma24 family protein